LPERSMITLAPKIKRKQGEKWKSDLKLYLTQRRNSKFSDSMAAHSFV
jgi:hypothetical protein